MTEPFKPSVAADKSPKSTELPDCVILKYSIILVAGEPKLPPATIALVVFDTPAPPALTPAVRSP